MNSDESVGPMIFIQAILVDGERIGEITKTRLVFQPQDGGIRFNLGRVDSDQFDIFVQSVFTSNMLNNKDRCA